ncbi:MAG TPA: copper resistance protein CopC [Ktedonobacterales bacterium]|nr:copper resistance protein CopC [Ktedonobacterales bacterium]
MHGRAHAIPHAPARRGGLRRWRLFALPALFLASLALALLPVGPGRSTTPSAQAHARLPAIPLHALPVRSDPPADAILQAPPSHVRIWFSEGLNGLTSRIVVVNTANREVDSKDSHVSSSDARELDVSLPLLPAGTYVVVWQSQSAEDGHVARGSYIFRIARPDGSVPPIPAVLPTGNVPGAGGTGAASGTLDGPGVAQALFTWLALLLLAFWVGGVIWETWILVPGCPRDPELRAAAARAAIRFGRLAPVALSLLLIVDVGVVLSEGAALAGDWSGAFSPALLRAVVFGSRFGAFWWLRQLVAAAALALMLLGNARGWVPWRDQAEPIGDAESLARLSSGSAGLTSSPQGTESAAIPDWRREALAVLRDVPHLPARLAEGWRARSWSGRLDLLLAALLLLAFALSGHAAAVPNDELAYALSVDLLHLLANAAWVGGLFYISAVLVPALADLDARTRARVLALGVPAFGVVAIVSATLLAATGSLNTTIHLTSVAQFVTTSYGRTLFVKIEFFLVMVAISAYHAFVIRPQLAQALDADADAEAEAEHPSPLPRAIEAVVAGTGKLLPRSTRPHSAGTSASGGHGDADELPAATHTLSDRLQNWLRREALVGVLILGCVALLAAFAGSLTPPAQAAPPASGAFVQTQQVSGYAITLKVTPVTFGTNTFTATVRDAQGNPVEGAQVLIQTTMLDMDMGVQNVQLQPIGASAPGSYTGQGDLTMAGHWGIAVKVLPKQAKDFIIAQFKITASY